MNKLLCLIALATPTWAAFITAGSFNTSYPTYSNAFPNANMSATLDDGTFFSVSWGSNAPQSVDFSGVFDFNHSYLNLTATGISFNGPYYPNALVTLNLTFTSDPPIPYTLDAAACQFPNPPGPNADLCAYVSHVPFTLTGSISVVDQGVTLYSNSLTTNGHAFASRIVGPLGSGVSASYNFNETPEPAPLVPILTGIAAILGGLHVSRNARPPQS